MVDENCFFTSQSNSKSLTFYNTKNLNLLKKLSNIDCSDSIYCLYKIMDKYLIVDSIQDFGLILMETKELIQYINNKPYLSFDKPISCDNNGNIYILGKESYFNNYYLLKMVIEPMTCEFNEIIKVNKISD